ncbi:hypothetical protein CBI38_00825 [Rhodococcus oxybenzonivorans]|uniref:Integrase catalytic domain-containing protein n=1 Tax=Rhodococcus oxybenzonivorans TaxID=1990687 RepID=A0A2S2BP35_9NOCA|nr:hypothetical protein CBI38_00825 [Rhodococcus oxybenzonivorans]
MTPTSTAEQSSTGRSEGAHSRSAVPGVRSRDGSPATSASKLTPTRRKLPHAPNHPRRYRNGHLPYPSPVHPALHPQHNGKVERYNRILPEGFLHSRDWISETQRPEAVVVWNVRYNYRRPHASDHLAQQPRQPFREASNSTLSLIHHAG